MDTISAIPSKSLTKDSNFSNFLIIVDAYSKIPNLYGMGDITSKEFIEKLDMFQARFLKVDEFG